MHDWAAGATKPDPASSLKTVSHQTALRNIMFHYREWSTCLPNWGKIYGYSYILATPHVETRGSENEEESSAPTSTSCVPRYPWQQWAIVTSQLLAAGPCVYDVTIGHQLLILKWYRHLGAVKCWFTSVKGQESCKWLVHRIPWTSIVRYVSWKKRQAPRFQRR